VIWVQPAGVLLGTEDPAQGCQATNATCNETQLRADNAINTIEPQFGAPQIGDLRPLANGNLFSAPTYAMPAFVGGDLPTNAIPAGTLPNSVANDYAGTPRTTTTPPGAYTAGAKPPVGFVYLPLIRRE
jgi:hypothetical protein